MTLPWDNVVFTTIVAFAGALVIGVLLLLHSDGALGRIWRTVYRIVASNNRATFFTGVVLAAIWICLLLIVPPENPLRNSPASMGHNAPKIETALRAVTLPIGIATTIFILLGCLRISISLEDDPQEWQRAAIAAPRYDEPRALVPENKPVPTEPSEDGPEREFR